MTDAVPAVVVQSPVVSSSANPWTAACQASLSLIISQSLPKFMPIALVMPSSHLILWCPRFLLPSIFPNIRDFSIESAVHIGWPKYQSFNFSISPSKECFGSISFKIGLISLLSKGLSGVFSRTKVWRHQFFGILPSLWSSSHNHNVTTGKTTAFTLLTFVGRLVSLLFNTLSRSNCLLISWLQSPSAVILEPKKRKFVITSTFFPFYVP